MLEVPAIESPNLFLAVTETWRGEQNASELAEVRVVHCEELEKWSTRDGEVMVYTVVTLKLYDSTG